jgi:hypothetical protein
MFVTKMAEDALLDKFQEACRVAFIAVSGLHKLNTPPP